MTNGPPPPPLSISDKVLGRGIFGLTANWTHAGNYYADVDNVRGQIAPSAANNDRQVADTGEAGRVGALSLLI